MNGTDDNQAVEPSPLESIQQEMEPADNPTEIHQPHGEGKEDVYVNLVSKFDDKQLAQIGSDVVKNFDKDKASRAEWEKKHTEWCKLFLGTLDEKTYPWPDASNICLPVLTTAVTQFQARAFEALIPPKGVVHALPINESEIYKQICDRVEKYMTYQTKFKMVDYEDGLDKTMMALAIDGTVIRKVYYDQLKKCPRVDYIKAEDFVIDYYAKNVSEAPRKTHIVRLTPNEILQRIEAGVFENADGLTTGGVISNGEIGQQADKSVGINQPTSFDEDSPREFYEQHTYIKIPGRGEIKEPVAILVDVETSKPVRIVSTINPITGEPFEHFIEYTFLPNPYSFYAVGFGLLLEHINKQINTSTNQLNDAGLLSNTKAGIVLKKSGMKKGDIKINQGSFQEVDLHTDDIRKAVQLFDFGQPSSVLLQLLGLMKEYVQELTTVSELTTGGMPSSDTPATTVMSLIEQGMKVFSSIHRRIHRSFTRELRAIYELNAIYMNLDEYFEIVVNKDLLVDDQGQAIPPELVKGQIARDFMEPINIQPVSDPNITSRVEKMAKAQFIYQSTLENPVTSQDPQKIMLAYKNYLTEMEVGSALANKLSTMPPTPQPPDLPQEEENRLFFSEKPTDALPTQNHQDHLRVIDDLLNSIIYDQMPANGKNELQAHRNQHIGFLYQQQAMAVKEGLPHPDMVPSMVPVQDEAQAGQAPQG